MSKVNNLYLYPNDETFPKDCDFWKIIPKKPKRREVEFDTKEYLAEKVYEWKERSIEFPDFQFHYLQMLILNLMHPSFLCSLY